MASAKRLCSPKSVGTTQYTTSTNRTPKMSRESPLLLGVPYNNKHSTRDITSKSSPSEYLSPRRASNARDRAHLQLAACDTASPSPRTGALTNGRVTCLARSQCTSHSPYIIIASGRTRSQDRGSRLETGLEGVRRGKGGGGGGWKSGGTPPRQRESRRRPRSVREEKPDALPHC